MEVSTGAATSLALHAVWPHSAVSTKDCHDSDPESFLQEGGHSAFAGVKRGSAQNAFMTTPTEFFHWYIVDERTGKRERTTYKLTRKDAEQAFPGAEPDLQSREVRDLSDPGRAPPSSRPGEEWVN